MDKHHEADRTETAELERLTVAITHSWEGVPDAVRHVQQQILPWFFNCSYVLDVCCGQGILLESLRSAGIAGEGIEGDPEMVKKAREKGLHVHLDDVPAGLKSLQGPYDGIFLGHIIEHFNGPEAVALLYYCLKLLKDGGIIAVQTPNAAHPDLNNRFWLDISHIRPYPQNLLNSMLTYQNCEILIASSLSNSCDYDTLVVGRKCSRELRRRTGLIWSGLLYSSAGYGHEIREFINAFDREDFDLKVVSLGYNNDNLMIPEEQAKFRVLEQIPVDPSQAVVITHFPPHPERRDIRGRVNIVRTMFETTGIPAYWVQPLSQLDEVWVPCHYNIETFSNCGIPPHKLRLVPSGVNSDVFRPSAPPLDLGMKKGFTFLSNFAWSDRKGWDLLLTAYLTEFRPDEDVTLLIKTAGDEAAIGGRVGRFIQERFSQQELPQIRVLTADFTNSMMPGLYTACNAFVLPSRGEAWGLPYIEAMASGLPTIGTRWSGNLEYMNDDNSYLVEIEGLENVPVNIDVPILIGHQWARPSVDHLRQQMRRVFEHRQEARARGERARADICAKWTFQHAAAAARRELLKYCNP